MLRARFEVPSEDFRPVVWPIPHPYWCSGHGDGYAILVAYVDDEAQLLRLWPDARAIDATEVNGIEFSDRFPQPDWWRPAR